MKKRICAAVCAMFVVGSFTSIPESQAGSGLGCADLTGCMGKANCGGKGSAAGCSITCADGGTIECKKELQ